MTKKKPAADLSAKDVAPFPKKEFLFRLFETLPYGVVCQDESGLIVTANPASERILGLTLDQMQGRTSYDPRWRAIREDGAPFPGESHPSMIALKEGREVRGVVMGVFHPGNGEYRWIRINATPHFRPGRPMPFQVYTIFEDITEIRRTETEKQAYLNKLSVLYKSSLAFGLMPDPAAIGREVLRVLEQVLKWKRGSIWIKGSTPGDLQMLAHSEMGLQPEPLAAEKERVKKLVSVEGAGISGWVAKHGLPIRCGNVREEPRYVEADPRILSELCVPLRAGGETIGSINVESTEPNFFSPHDEELLTTIAVLAAVAMKNTGLIEALKAEVGEREAAEIRLRASLDEKTLLLGEIHHWVNNNLQIMSSLLRLQAARVPDLEFKKIIRSNQSRIRSLGLVYEKLVSGGDLSRIELADYVKSLTAYLFQFHNVDEARVRFLAETEPISLDLQTAVPVGLIINELVENALLHAFPDGRAGTVRVDLKSDEAGRIELSVADDGPGVPGGIGRLDDGTFGWTLIRLLAGQIDGQVEAETVPGLRVRVVFKELAYKRRF